MNIGTVVEGPSDRLVLKEILNRICPDEPRYFDIQPSSPLGEMGTGWKGVQRWCQNYQGSGLDKFLSSELGSPLDLLVIQVDAEIACETDLQDGSEFIIHAIEPSCPPIQPTIDHLRQIITAGWLKKGKLPPQVILVVPAQDTENWTFAALFPDDALCAANDYECPKFGQRWRDRPGYRLTRKKYGQLLEFKAGKVKKSKRRYEALAKQVAENWDRVCHICSQAEQFNQDIHNLLTTSETHT